MRVLGLAADGRRLGGGVERAAQVVGRVGGNLPRRPAEEPQAARVGIERLDRAAQHDVHERVDVESRGEGVAHAPHRRLQAAALVDGELQAALGLLDARAAIAGEEDEQPGERQDEQDAGQVVDGGVAGEEADRRQAGVDDDHVGEDLDLQARRDAAGGGLAQRRGGGVEQATAQQRQGQQRKVGEAELGRACDDEHERRSECVPRVGDREEQSQRRAAAAYQVCQAREDQAGGHQQRHGGRRQQHEHRHEHELRGEDVAGPDRELDSRDQRVERDEHDGGRDVEARQRAGHEQERDGAQREQQTGHELRQELAAVDTARPRLPGLLQESLGGAVAANVVPCVHPRP